MPANNIILMTLGSWETTNLLNNDQEIAASRLFLQIVCDSERGGIAGGSAMEHSVVLLDESGAPADDGQRYPLFPGRFEADLNIPTGAKNPDGAPVYSRNLVVVENAHPTVNMDYTRVWFASGSGGSVTQDDEVTEQLLELYIELDYPQNIVRGYIRLYKHPILGRDSELAITLL